MERINLTIPGMKSAHCQMTVTNVVKAVGGKITSIAPAKAEIEVDNALARDAVIQAIEKAGYKVTDGTH